MALPVGILWVMPLLDGITPLMIDDCQYFSTTTPSPSKSTKVNPTTIPNPNRLSATLMSVDEGEGGGSASYGVTSKIIAVLAPVGNT